MSEPEELPFLVRATVFRPVTVLMLALAFLVVGMIAYPRIPLQLMPEGLAFPGANIYIPVPDSTPREVMEEVVKPAEDFLRTIPGVKRIVSSSSARRANIRLEFAPKAGMDLMVAEVRDRLDRARAQWPPQVDRYFIWRQNASDMPVFVTALSLEVDEARSPQVDMDHLFDHVIKKRLEAIDGVARVTVWGILDKRVEIGLDPDRVEAHGIRLLDLVTRLQQDHRTMQAGTVRQGDRELLIRVDGKLRTFQEVLEYPAGQGFRIRDFAGVDFGTTVRDRLSRVNGHLSRVVVLHKESAANSVAVCDRIEAGLKEIEAHLRRTVPGVGRVDSHAWMNQGEMIRYSIASLKESGLYGAFFAVLVLYAFFRRVGMTVLVTLSIPFSFLITLVWMFFRGQSFNVLSLMGLTLGVGMLVDNSIVVVENILRHREAGLGPRAAAIAGVREVGLAISLATLTTVIVFFPGVFIEDPLMRGFFAAIGEPVGVSVMASLLVALVFVPQGAIHLLRLGRARARPTVDSRQSTVDSGLPVDSQPLTVNSRAPGFSRTNQAFALGVSWCLANRVEALVLTCGLFVFGQVLFQNVPKSQEGMEGPRRLEMNLKLQKNFTLREADQVFQAVEKVILDRKEELGVKSVTCWFSPSEGEVNIFLHPGVSTKEKDFFARLKPLLPALPGVTYKLGFEDFARGEGGQRLRVFVRGTDLDRLEELGDMVRRDLEDRSRFPELDEVTRWEDEDIEEVRVEVARRLAQEHGTDTATIHRMVSWALRGALLPDFEVEDREYPFWVRYQGGYKENVEELDAVRVFRPGREPLRLENVARYSIVPGSGEIHRTGGKMTVGFSARVHGDFQAAREKVERHFLRFPLPEGFDIAYRQENRGFEENLRDVIFATTLALLLVFFVMGLLFESFILPLSVLLSIPHAFFGSLFLLWAWQLPLDPIGMVGFLILVGIVVNNAIVLVDCVNALRRKGVERGEAIVQAVQLRFRPIWMTALTTIFGLLPLLFVAQSGEGVDYKCLAVVLAGGLTTSTFFTLFVVPLFYTFFDDLALWGAAFLRLSPRDLKARARFRSASPGEGNVPGGHGIL